MFFFFSFQSPSFFPSLSSMPYPITLFLHPPLLPQPPGWSFLSSSLFKTLLLLSITRWSFRSPPWSNTPQRFTWNRGHAQLIHHFPPTHHPSLLLHSCTFWSLFIHAPSQILSCAQPPSLLVFSFPGFLMLIYHRGNVTPQYTCTDTQQHIHCMPEIPTWADTICEWVEETHRCYNE